MGSEKNNSFDHTLKNIVIGDSAPISGYVLLVLLYIITTVTTSKMAGAQGSFVLFGMVVPLVSMTGVFSALGNMCLILLVIFYKKLGYVTSLAIMLFQIPLLVMKLIFIHLNTSLAGLFTDVFTIIAITLIYVKNRSIYDFQMRIREQAVTDMLTGIPNRFACRTLIEDLISKQEKFAVVAVDISNFRSINDTMGHDFGNKVLKEIASRWKEIAESGDTDTSDFIGRLGGDEFSIIIRDASDDEAIMKTISAYRSSLENKMTIDDCDYYISAFYGYSRYPEDAKEANALVSGAYAAMHEATRAKSGTSVLRFTHDLLRDEKVMEIERKVRDALDNDTVFFHLQPQYDVDHRLYGFEALARMKDENGNFISPADFIPVAENAGLIDQIDMKVYKLAVRFLHDVMEKSSAKIVMSVNVSVRHLMKNNFISEIRDILEEYNVPADRIEIEITESVMVDSVEKALSRIDELKALGIKIAIDDFGTGYSSLSYLNKFPADLLKIDKSFIDEMNSGESSRQYVATIIKIGHLFGFDVISEGVESEDQIETLREIGCDYIQGFVWGRPTDPEEAMKLVLS